MSGSAAQANKDDGFGGAAPAGSWHARPVAEVFAALGSGAEGLSPAEAARRLATDGPNRVPEPRRRSASARFLSQFHDLLIYVLLAAAAMTAALRDWIDTGVILGVVVINAAIGFVQEGKAERALEAIKGMLSQRAFVRRQGRSEQIDAVLLARGDVVFLQAGDKIPADVRLFQVRNLRVDESILTGESTVVDKGTDALDLETGLAERRNMGYSGTLVTYGQGSGVVIATGSATEIGRISALLERVQTLSTPLTRQMARFGRWLSLSILLLALATFLLGVLLHGEAPAAMFLAAVGLAVAAIPEGLPAIMTITLAVGVQRMARRSAIIRRLPAVETLGAVTVICSDKTGTLTRNEMTVQSVVTVIGAFQVTGTGYDSHGDFLSAGARIVPADHPVLHELCRAALLCNEAAVTQDGDAGWRLHGDPTEGALLVMAMKAGLDADAERGQWPRTDVIPFESEHRFMASLHHDHAGNSVIYVKGAPERLLDMCRRQRTPARDEALNRDYWEGHLEALAGRGQRTLALACKPLSGECSELRFDDVNAGLTLLGVVGMIDPPRAEAVLAVRTCRAAGVRVMMITGDHPATARAIAEQVGIGEGRRVVTGAELQRWDDARLAAQVGAIDVYARTSPEHKLRLVQALQAAGAVAAMTGDGVNDAPALKRADVGIAMGMKGTEAAKEAAEMVLADDNFASIAAAIEEGRTVYDNLRKAIMFVLPTNGGEALTILAAVALGTVLPITPAQILWVNMVTAVTLALALAFEMPEQDVMRRPPRPPAEPILTPFLLWRVASVSLLMVSGTFGIFIRLYDGGAGIELARTAAVNTLVAFEAFYLFSARFTLAPALTRAGLLGNRYVLLAIAVLIVLQLLFTYAPGAQRLFGTEALGAGSWAAVLGVATSVLVLVELEKFLLRRRGGGVRREV